MPPTSLVYRLAVFVVGGVGSVIAVLRIKHPGWLGVALATLVAIGVFVAAVCEVGAWLRARPKRCKSDAKIREFMLSWISTRGALRSSRVT